MKDFKGARGKLVGQDLKVGRKGWFQEHRLGALVKGHSFSETLKKKILL